MNQLSLFQAAVLKVSELTRYVRQLLESDEVLQDVWVQGEVSNLSTPRSGHIYFTLKDQQASLKCVIWRSNAMRIRVPLRDGQAVEVHGSIGLYERDGQYQLYVQSVRLAGEGLLYQEFLRLKEELEEEGLFAEERKRPLPEFPRVVGIVSSPTAAALQDILNTLRQRFPLAEVVLSPTSVQGEAAPSEIVAAIQKLNREVKPDVIILARGGGSLEDLWSFNDERVVRAVAASEAPVVSGVGHETDFTLVDFASDVRAPTPTGAAVMAVPDKQEIRSDLMYMFGNLMGAFQYVVEGKKAVLRDTRHRLQVSSPAWRIQNDIQRLDNLSERLLRASRQAQQIRHLTWKDAHNRLNSNNPLAILQRGYAVINNVQGKIIKNIGEVQSGQQVQVRLVDGSFKADVKEISAE